MVVKEVLFHLDQMLMDQSGMVKNEGLRPHQEVVWCDRPFPIRESVWSLQHPKFVAYYRKQVTPIRLRYLYFMTFFGVTMGTIELCNE